MLELRDTYFTIRKGNEEVHLLDNVSLRVPPGHFMAIVGPSGCGKSTLLKLIAGINLESAGSVFWRGRDLSHEEDLAPSEIGYVPQFSIAYDQLTVEESIESAVRLRVKIKDRDTFFAIVDHALVSTGLEPIRDRPVRVLSGGQKRRLALAMELVTDPALLLCDEVTSGLDPRSEQEIVTLMHQMSRQQQRIVINVTHSLAGLDLYDSVLVLHEGKVVYHGPPRALEHYFSVNEAENIYPALTKRGSTEWQQSWMKRQAQYYQSSGMDFKPDQFNDLAVAKTPGSLTQVMALLGRRFKIFFRDSGQLLLQIAILVGFPVLVILFDLDGVDQTKNLSDTPPRSLVELEAERSVTAFNLNLGGLVSGLVMFQVILLTLMASNNSSREIAGERRIFEKEKLGGVRPGVYLASKMIFLSLLVIVQSVWMWLFTQTICNVPSVDIHHLALLVLVNAAMTTVCLAISALAKTADQASLLSIYLVGFQLPLSGAVLALPEWAAWVTRPFISAYWSWAGIMDSLDPHYKKYVSQVTETWLSPVSICYVVLLAHLVVGMLLAYGGVRRGQWSD